MKHILFLALLITTNAMAIDFNKVTGAFAEAEKFVEAEAKSDLTYGSFDPEKATTRAPASVETEAQKGTWGNEMTGTFEYQNN